MMNLISAYISKVLLILSLLLPGLGFAQHKFLPSGLRLGVDIPRLAITALDKQRVQYEFQADIDFHRFFLAFDYGIAERTRETPDFVYTNKGNYFKVGADINLLRNQKHGNVLFLGLRYANSTFSDQMSLNLEDASWGQAETLSANDRVNANWFEFVSGLKVKIWKGLYMGYAFRFKFIKSQEDTENLMPYDIPGYGLAEHNSSWGANYYLFYRIPFRKK